ncbi:MAG: type II toxin-antitoxin system RelB/DinJ family antitoxin [Lachnospiraceae bacterium]|jgi:DNA-damage-inducible protein J|nr:type II toxin-antitoxin system RelB/DinJ family antitoxin [Lachnospiraceae bacterium]
MITNINIRTDSEIKSRAQDIYASLGLDMTTAINLFLRQTVRQNDLPFILTTNAKPGKKSRAAMFGALHGKYKTADDFDAPLDDFKEYMK